MVNSNGAEQPRKKIYDTKYTVLSNSKKVEIINHYTL